MDRTALRGLTSLPARPTLVFILAVVGTAATIVVVPLHTPEAGAAVASRPLRARLRAGRAAPAPLEGIAGSSLVQTRVALRADVAPLLEDPSEQSETETAGRWEAPASPVEVRGVGVDKGSPQAGGAEGRSVAGATSETPIDATLWVRVGEAAGNFLQHPVFLVRRYAFGHGQQVGSQQGNADPVVRARHYKFGRSLGEAYWSALPTLVIWILLTLLVAYYYEPIKAKLWAMPSDNLEHTRDQVVGHFRYGPFSCFGDPFICFFTVFCAPIRWADTVHMAGTFFNFWPSLGIMLCLMMLNIPTFGALFGLVLIAIEVYCRQKFRDKFKMDRNNCSSIVADCLMYIFCPLCAICQEARHVEEAHAVGWEAGNLESPAIQ